MDDRVNQVLDEALKWHRLPHPPDLLEVHAEIRRRVQAWPLACDLIDDVRLMIAGAPFPAFAALSEKIRAFDAALALGDAQGTGKEE